MIRKTIAGLQWHAISPSFYELAGYPSIDLSYVGDIWYLHIADGRGEPQMYPFKSRDEAALEVASYIEIMY